MLSSSLSSSSSLHLFFSFYYFLNSFFFLFYYPEIKAEHHPCLDPQAQCPKGSYESTQANQGVYIQVDMPGVPPGRVKLFKDTQTRTVTFTGRAPNDWEFDSTERVYGGYVALDCDPAKLDAEMTVINGCLRLFFPAAHGSLHFFPSKTPVQHDGVTTPNCSYINPSLSQGVQGVCESQLVHNASGMHLYLRVDMPGIEEKGSVVMIN